MTDPIHETTPKKTQGIDPDVEMKALHRDLCYALSGVCVSPHILSGGLFGLDDESKDAEQAEKDALNISKELSRIFDRIAELHHDRYQHLCDLEEEESKPRMTDSEAVEHLVDAEREKAHG